MTSAIFLPLSPASNFPFLTSTLRARARARSPARLAVSVLSDVLLALLLGYPLAVRGHRSAQLPLRSSGISHPRNVQGTLATEITGEDRRTERKRASVNARHTLNS